MKNECTYKVVWATETVDGVDRGEKEFEEPVSAYTFADNIKKKEELFETFIIKKLDLIIINTYSLI